MLIVMLGQADILRDGKVMITMHGSELYVRYLSFLQ